MRGSEERGLPRVVEAALAGAGLVVSAPLLAGIAAAIKLTSKGPVVFQQQRVGRFGAPFTLYKLRTMSTGASGPGVTASGDRRVTGVGKILRKTKLDELPELWNIVKGDMAFVGSRPEVPQYVDPHNALWKRVLEERPGLTHPVTIRLRNEEELLARQGGDPSLFYRRTLLPWKLRGYIAYQAERTWKRDLGVILETGLAVVLPSRALLPTLDEVENSYPRDAAEWAA